MTAQLQELKNTGSQKPADVPEPDPQPKAPKVEDFLLTEEQLDLVLDDPSLINKAMSNMFTKVLDFVQDSLAAVPATVSQRVYF